MSLFMRRGLARFLQRHGTIRTRFSGSEYERFGRAQSLNGSSEPFSQREKAMLGVLAVGGVGMLVGVGTHLERVPVTNRLRFMAIGSEAEEELGRQSFEQVIQQYQNKLYPGTHPVVQRIENIARRVIDRTPLRSLPWTVHVVRSPDVNCFVLPGRHVFVFEGILPILDTDDAMAAVLGHEIAHLYARHAAERLSLRYVLFGISMLISLSGIDVSPFFKNLLLTVGLQLPFSRKMESEADVIGLNLMSECCFDPAAAPTVFERMEALQHGKNQPPRYLSTHPPNPERVQQLKDLLPAMRAAQERSGCHEADMLNEYMQQNFGVRYR